MTTALRQETYLPNTESAESLATVHNLFEAGEAKRRGGERPQYFLAGPDGDRVELPAEVYEVLRQIVDALQHGLAVTVAPLTQTLTTQQAADLLGVSRPTVIKLLDVGKIPFDRPGDRGHRRILLRDLLEYQKHRRAAQYAAIEATSISIDEEEDLETTLRRLREARRVIAERRRRQSP